MEKTVKENENYLNSFPFAQYKVKNDWDKLDEVRQNIRFAKERLENLESNEKEIKKKLGITKDY